MMGSDAVDRQFRKPEIKLECADCGRVGDVKTRYPGENDEALLCLSCYVMRECEHGWAGI